MYHVLAHELEDDVTKCAFMFGAKEVFTKYGINMGDVILNP